MSNVIDITQRLKEAKEAELDIFMQMQEDEIRERSADLLDAVADSLVSGGPPYTALQIIKEVTRNIKQLIEEE